MPRHVKRSLFYVLVCGATALVGGCAHHYSGAAMHPDPYGFFSGVWHGMILPYSVVVNLVSWALGFLGVDFLSDVQIIGRPNTGIFFYYLGFLLGLSVYSSAGGQRPRVTSGAYDA